MIALRTAKLEVNKEIYFFNYSARCLFAIVFLSFVLLVSNQTQTSTLPNRDHATCDFYVRKMLRYRFLHLYQLFFSFGFIEAFLFVCSLQISLYKFYLEMVR